MVNFVKIERKVDFIMAFYLKGVHLPHNKNTARMSAVKMPVPETVTIPTAMHIGAPAKPVVKVGDSVCVGTLIAEQNGFVSSPVYSSVSGTVAKIDEVLLSNGKTAPAIVINSDGEMTLDSSICAPVVGSREELLDAIKKSGIVGLGGAGFPTYVKFDTDKPIEALVINGAECEPYITSDSVTMVQRKDDIEYALNVLTKYFGIKEVIIGIENNKPAAIKSMKEITLDSVKFSVKVLKSSYPQGAEKVLIYNTTKKIVPMGKLPIDVGCVVSNSSTIAEMGKFLKTGIPLVDRCVTVDGSAIKNPQNVIVPIGTSIADVFEFCGGLKSELKKVIYGGPMMGVAIPHTDMPVLKNTNALLAFDQKDAVLPKTTHCIKCGACANNCPFNINPVEIAVARENEDYGALEKAGTMLCMECGCCSFVCPAKIPIVQNNKLAKDALKNHQMKERK